MGLLSKLFGSSEGSCIRDPEFFEEIGECDHDCLVCSHLDKDCKGDDDWEYEMMIEEGAFGDEDDW